MRSSDLWERGIQAMNIKVLMLSLALLCPMRSFSQDQHAVSLRSLPPEIAIFLDKKYPGWRFSSSVGKDIKCFDKETRLHPSLAWGDFNGDGKVDFALQIVHNKMIYGLEFLSRGGSYTPTMLFSGSNDGKHYSGAMTIERRNQKNSIGMIEHVDSLAIGECGDIPARYIFRNGRIRNETPRD